MSVHAYFAVVFTVTANLFWNLPGDVLAAPARALCGWKGIRPSPSQYVCLFYRLRGLCSCVGATMTLDRLAGTDVILI